MLPEPRPETRGRPRVTLVAMPWESIARPSLAVGTLTALAHDAGVDCSGLYLDLDLAARVGTELYTAFAETLELFPVGEHLFSCDLFGADALDSDAYLARFGSVPMGEPGAAADPLRELRDLVVPAFLADATARTLQRRPDVVGFTCTFNQVLPSLALAAHLRRAAPDLTILFGGACVHGSMGPAYLDAFGDVIDFVFTGEADESFVLWLEAYRDGSPDRTIAGVAGHRTRAAAALPEHLDAIPVPDFTDFFDQHEALDVLGASLPAVRHIPYESSRGCWWGERSHCTFCGLNNDGLHYRRRSVERVVGELDAQSARYGITSFMAADNILDFRAYGTLLTELARRPTDYDLFYEIKSNVHRADVAMLRRAGVWRVQPGIESFVDHVLVLMRKGVSGLRNVQLLKWLYEHGIAVDYNILVGFPGETAEDHDELLRVITALRHLPPPNGRSTVVRVDRFSPFYDHADELGIVGVRAADHHRHLIPLDVLDPERYAYFFDRDLSGLDAVRDRIDRLDAAIGEWKASNLVRRARLGNGFVEVQEYTGGRLTRHVLRGVDAGVFVRTDAQTSVATLCRELVELADGPAVVDAVDRLIDAGVLVAMGGNVVNVVPFSEPRTTADLEAWAASFGLAAPARPRRTIDVVAV